MLWSSAVGALVGSALKNTAVPGTEVGGDFSSEQTSPSSGVSSRRVFAARIFVPLRQVIMTSITMAPIRSGTHPPWKTLSKFAERKVVSMARSGNIIASVTHSGHFQTLKITIIAIIVVTTMVPVTAMP